MNGWRLECAFKSHSVEDGLDAMRRFVDASMVAFHVGQWRSVKRMLPGESWWRLEASSVRELVVNARNQFMRDAMYDIE